jgi:hypothetical protein
LLFGYLKRLADFKKALVKARVLFNVMAEFSWQELGRLELARTRPWINYSTHSWLTAYSRKSQAVLERPMRQCV